MLAKSFKDCYYPQERGGINVGLLGENCHKINMIASESLLLNEDDVPLLWNTSYTTSLSKCIPN